MTTDQLRKYSAEEIMDWIFLPEAVSSPARYFDEDGKDMVLFDAWRPDTDHKQLQQVEEKAYPQSVTHELVIHKVFYSKPEYEWYAGYESIDNSEIVSFANAIDELLARLRLAVQAHQAQGAS